MLTEQICASSVLPVEGRSATMWRGFRAFRRDNAEIADKLTQIAYGNIDLVQEAIRNSQARPDLPADLERIVQYIVTHRTPESPEHAT
jgi:hypothetical protein